jgi:hypothetical protein
MKAMASVLVAVAGWAFVFDAYRQRGEGESAAGWLRRVFDADTWSWWAPALAAAAFAVLGIAAVADRNWWGVSSFLLAAAMLRVALLRKRGLPTRQRGG